MIIGSIMQYNIENVKYNYIKTHPYVVLYEENEQIQIHSSVCLTNFIIEKWASVTYNNLDYIIVYDAVPCDEKYSKFKNAILFAHKKDMVLFKLTWL